MSSERIKKGYQIASKDDALRRRILSGVVVDIRELDGGW